MKMWGRDQNIFVKLLLAGGISMMFVVIPSTLIATYFFSKSNTADRIHTIADKMEREILLARISGDKFVQNDLTNPDFYDSGTSENVKANQRYMSDVQNEISKLIRLWSGPRERQARDLLVLIDRYRSVFSEIVGTYLEIGFKDKGLFGEWRRAIHDVERAVSKIGETHLHETLLQLRRKEKDYLLRGDITYLNDIKSRLTLLRKQIAGIPTTFPVEIVERIDAYESAFDRYLFLQKKIGRTDKEGLQKEYAQVVHEMKPAIYRIYREALDADQKARQSFMIVTALIYFFGIGLGGVVFYFLARSISLRLTELKRAVLRVGRGHLETRLTSDSKDEIGVVEEAFNKMTKDLKKITVSKNYVDKIIASMADMLIVINPENRIEKVNKTTLDVLGYGEEALLGMNIGSMFFDPVAGETFFKEFIQKQWVSNAEMEFARESGSKIPVLFSGSTMTDGSGTVLGFVCVAQDYSQRKKTADALKQSEKDLRMLSTKILESQENERRKVARELHDGVGQALTGIKFYLENSLIKQKKEFSDAGFQELEKAIGLIRDTVEETRRISMGLRPSTLDDIGISETLFWFCSQFEEIYTTIRIKKQIEFDEAEISDDLKTTIFRVTQEALNNVAKHSGADRVFLSLRNEGDHIALRIDDNGTGFKIGAPFHRKNVDEGFGLAGMKERVELSGGAFSIDPVLKKGCRIAALWPVPPKG
jgi:PAS domain S-box-containing protein